MRARLRLVVVLASITVGGCGPHASGPAPSKTQNLPSAATSKKLARPSVTASPSEPPSGHPREFFPTQVGTKWIYEIKVIGDERPLEYEQISWPIGPNRSATYATRGILHDRRSDPSHGAGRSYTLELSVKDTAAKQGPLEYPLGVELQVVRDELGVFAESKQVFWAVADSDRYTANLVVTYDSDAPGAPTVGGFGRWGQGDGNSVRLFFFGDRPGIEIGIEGSPDSLRFQGVKSNLIAFEGTECLFFTRFVAAPKERDGDSNSTAMGADQLKRGFKEDTWFARGKGLVRLEQFVDDLPTMTWTLKQFISGEKR